VIGYLQGSKVRLRAASCPRNPIPERNSRNSVVLAVCLDISSKPVLRLEGSTRRRAVASVDAPRASTVLQCHRRDPALA
jgi:hypothetical protein